AIFCLSHEPAEVNRAKKRFAATSIFGPDFAVPASAPARSVPNSGQGEQFGLEGCLRKTNCSSIAGFPDERTVTMPHWLKSRPFRGDYESTFVCALRLNRPGF